MNMFNIVSAIIFNIDFLLQIIMVMMIPTNLARMSPVPGVLREDRMIANGKMLQVWLLNRGLQRSIHHKHCIVAPICLATNLGQVSDARSPPELAKYQNIDNYL